MASLVVAHACVKARMRVLVSTSLKRPLFRGLCLRVSAGDGVREKLIACNETPEITLQKGKSKDPNPSVNVNFNAL